MKTLAFLKEKRRYKCYYVKMKIFLSKIAEIMRYKFSFIYLAFYLCYTIVSSLGNRCIIWLIVQLDSAYCSPDYNGYYLPTTTSRKINLVATLFGKTVYWFLYSYALMWTLQWYFIRYIDLQTQNAHSDVVSRGIQTSTIFLTSAQIVPTSGFLGYPVESKIYKNNYLEYLISDLSHF